MKRVCAVIVGVVLVVGVSFAGEKAATAVSLTTEATAWTRLMAGTNVATVIGLVSSNNFKGLVCHETGLGSNVVKSINAVQYRNSQLVDLEVTAAGEAAALRAVRGAVTVLQEMDLNRQRAEARQAIQRGENPDRKGPVSFVDIVEEAQIKK